MPGLSTGLSAGSPVVVSGFYHELIVELVAIAAVALAVVVGAVAWRRLRGAPRAAVAAEPVARCVVRVAFGAIWVFDGILQAQASMPLAMVPQVVAPAASTSPGWVQAMVNWGGNLWNQHPISVPASAVWIQLGIGIWLLVAPRGWWSRAAGLVSLAWSVLVWALGEAFGGIFAPGLSWLTGAPGGVVFYAVAGLLVALPLTAWTPRLGRRLLAIYGSFLVAMALLQAWPGRGSWQGAGRHTTGNLTATLQTMAGNSQPHWLASLIAASARGVGAHGGAVNLVVVVLMTTSGVLLLTGRRTSVRAGVGVLVALTLVDWVIVQDMGFWGGVGTDPNSMLPQAILVVVGALALRAAPSEAPARVPRLAPLVTSAASLVAVGVLVVGSVPALAASVAPAASPVLAEAAGGAARALDRPVPAPVAARMTSGSALLVEVGHCGARTTWEVRIAASAAARWPTTVLVRGGCASLTVPAGFVRVSGPARDAGSILVIHHGRERAAVEVRGPHSSALRSSYATVLVDALVSSAR